MIRAFRPDKVPLLKIKSTWGKHRSTDIITDFVALEIGAGAGWFAIQFAKLNPNGFIYSIEHTSTRFEKLNRRVRNHPDLSVRIEPIHANAISWITHSVPESSVDVLFIPYPNPYPKKKHENQRWHLSSFFERLVWTLKPGGVFILATNLEDYAVSAITQIPELWGLECEQTEILNKIPELTKMTSVSIPRSQSIFLPAAPWTHFEKKFLSKQERVWHLIFRKKC